MPIGQSSPDSQVRHGVRAAALVLLMLALCGCSSMQAVSVESAMRGQLPHDLDFGSLVEVKTLDGRKAKFRVTELNAGGIGGSAGFFWYDELQSLELERPDQNVDTVGIVLGVLGVAALVWIVGNADSVSVCSGAPCPGTQP